MRIHYDGWGPKWDESILVKSPRLCFVPGTHIPPDVDTGFMHPELGAEESQYMGRPPRQKKKPNRVDKKKDLSDVAFEVVLNDEPVESSSSNREEEEEISSKEEFGDAHNSMSDFIIFIDSMNFKKTN